MKKTAPNSEPPKRRIGRPPIEIDWSLVEKLAHVHCTPEEIAAIIGCDRTTLIKKEQFITVYNKGREGGKASLRRMQFKLAEKSAGMAIWLGKQLLGQKEDMEPRADVDYKALIQAVRDDMESNS